MIATAPPAANTQNTQHASHLSFFTSPLDLEVDMCGVVGYGLWGCRVDTCDYLLPIWMCMIGYMLAAVPPAHHFWGGCRCLRGRTGGRRSP
eukprot:8183864-Pyramimonas_sp.AAC.1